MIAPAADKALLSTRKISKRFGGVVALDEVSIDVQSGELLAICGENGAGKSTLMKILCGQHTEYEGQLILKGNPVWFSGTKQAEAAGIGIIHQELNLVEELSVAANLFLGREESHLGFLQQKSMRQKAVELLSKLQCDISPDALTGSLRVGDQQLIEIAKAIGFGAEILIMDEPTSALTEHEVTRLDRVIHDLRSQGVTILYISHKMDEIFRLSDRITVLRDGKYIDTVETQQSNPSEIARMMVGKGWTDQTQLNKEKTSAGPPVLTVRNLWRDWPGHAKQWRLKEISFELKAGEILGVAGLMGAGRTELLECLFGCSEDSFGGEIDLAGKKTWFQHPEQAIQAGISMVTEDRKRLGLFHNLSVKENVTICSLSEYAKLNLISHQTEQAQCQTILDDLQVKLAGQSAMIGSLSGGNQQKCVIGRALLTQPKILLLDDPTRGVDVGAKAEIYRLLRKLADEGIAILMTSSEITELLLVSDRIIVLCEGQLTGEFDAHQVSRHEIMEAATRINTA